METRYVCEFLEFSKSLNYSQTAKELFITPTTLSNHIRDLEENLGFALLRKNANVIELTPAGKLFAQEAPAFVASIRNLKAKCFDVQHNTVLIRVQANPYIVFQNDLIRAKATYHEKHGQHIELSIIPKAQPLKEALGREIVDIGFRWGIPTINEKSSASINEGAYVGYKYRDDRIAFYADATHPLASRDSISAQDLSGCSLLLAKAGEYEGRENSFLDTLKTEGINLNCSIRRVQDWLDVAFTELDGCIGACLESVYNLVGLENNPAYKRFVIEDFEVSCGIYIMFNPKKAGKELQTFLEELRLK